MPKKYRVTLTEAEREELQQLIRAGKTAARTQSHARILLKADSGPEGPAWTDEAIHEALEVSRSTIARVRERFVEEGLDAALYSKHWGQPKPRKLDGEQEAHLIALACSTPPEGYRRWTLRLLAEAMVEREEVETLSHETVRQTLKKTNSSRI